MKKLITKIMNKKFEMYFFVISNILIFLTIVGLNLINDFLLQCCIRNMNIIILNSLRFKYYQFEKVVTFKSVQCEKKAVFTFFLFPDYGLLHLQLASIFDQKSIL